MEVVTAAVNLVLREQNALTSAQTKHPNWPAPNYVDPQTRLSLLMGVSCASGFIMLILVGIRIYTRHTMSQRGLGIDDLLMVLAAFFSTALIVIVCICATHGTGYHNWDIRPEWYPTWGKATFSQNLAFVPATTLTKISILHTYLYLFPSQSNRRFCFTMISILWVWGLVQIIVTFLQCRPITSYWDTRAKKECILINPYLYSSGALNSFTDVVVYLWPSRMLFSLQLPLIRRLGLLAIFSTGLIAVIASILRLVSIRNASRSDDSTWEGTFIALWKVLEVTFGVKCGCLPGAKPFFQRFLPRSGTTMGRSKATGHSSNNNFNRLEEGFSSSYVKSDKGIAMQGFAFTTPHDRAIGVTSTTTVTSIQKPNSGRRDLESIDEDEEKVSL